MSVSCALGPPCNKLAPVSANFAVWWRHRSGAAVDWPFLLASAQTGPASVLSLHGGMGIRLPEVRGRACSQAAGASYASCRFDYIAAPRTRRYLRVRGAVRADYRRPVFGTAPGPQPPPVPAAALVLYLLGKMKT
jgi:hypothetical protein